MTINAIEITKGDLVRIASAVGTVAITIGNEASSMKDIKESLELVRLHVKLVHVLEEMEKNEHKATT